MTVAFVVETEEWIEQAACQKSSDNFFLDGRSNSVAYKSTLTRLRMICGGCPVIRQCDEYAEKTYTHDGFWAGLTEEERHERRHRRSPEAIRESRETHLLSD